MIILYLAPTGMSSTIFMPFSSQQKHALGARSVHSIVLLYSFYIIFIFLCVLFVQKALVNYNCIGYNSIMIYRNSFQLKLFRRLVI